MARLCLVLLIGYCVVGALPVLAQESGDTSYETNPPLRALTPEPVHDTLLAALLATGTRKKLRAHPSYDELSDVPSNRVRLYSLRTRADCIPETHSHCLSRYFLAVAENDALSVESAVYRLGTFGELARIRWKESESRRFSHLQFVARRYPAWAVERNPALNGGQQEKRYERWGPGLYLVGPRKGRGRDSSFGLKAGGGRE